MNDLLLKRKSLEEKRQCEKKHTRLNRILKWTVEVVGYGLCILFFIWIWYAYFNT